MTMPPGMPQPNLDPEDRVLLQASDPRAAGSRRLLTIVETAEYLRVSKWTVYSLLRSNQLGSVHLHTRHLVPIDEIERFLHQQYKPRGDTHGQEKR